MLVQPEANAEDNCSGLGSGGSSVVTSPPSHGIVGQLSLIQLLW